jgi:hypothetical protein
LRTLVAGKIATSADDASIASAVIRMGSGLRIPGVADFRGTGKAARSERTCNSLRPAHHGPAQATKLRVRASRQHARRVGGSVCANAVGRPRGDTMCSSAQNRSALAAIDFASRQESPPRRVR